MANHRGRLRFLERSLGVLALRRPAGGGEQGPSPVAIARWLNVQRADLVDRMREASGDSFPADEREEIEQLATAAVEEAIALFHEDRQRFERETAPAYR